MMYLGLRQEKGHIQSLQNTQMVMETQIGLSPSTWQEMELV